MDDRFVSCNFQTVCDIQDQIIKIKTFLNLYRWIMDAYVSDFFVRDFWSCLPASWTEHMRKLSPPEISFLLRQDVKTYRDVAPLSLLAYRKCILSLAIGRHPVDLDSEEQVQKIFNSLEADTVCSTDFSSHIQTAEICETNSGKSKGMVSGTPSRRLAERPEWRGVMKNGQWMELEHVYRKHVKPKKQHEIQKLSQTISYLCCLTQSQQVVDVGAGLGHLSRLLTFGHGVKVTTVEASGGHAPKATKYDRETKKDIKKAKLKKQKLKGTESVEVHAEQTVDLPSHISCLIQPNISTSHFLDLIKQSRWQQQQTESDEQMVTGESGGHLVNSDAYSDNLKGHVTNCGNEQYQMNCVQDTKSVNQPGAFFKNSIPKTIIECEHCQNQQNSHIVSNMLDCEDQNFIRCKCRHDKSRNQNPSIKTQLIEESHAQKINVCKDTLVNDDEHFVLAGLHACGDLTPTLIRMFVNCEASIGLASVGCCYMKLSVDDSCETHHLPDSGYPMSQFVKGLKGSGLTYSARELGCHFADAYIQRLIDNPDHLKVHSYRAALQHLIVSLLPDYQHGSLRLTVKNATDTPFDSYAKLALQKLGFTSDIPYELLHEAESYLPLWKDVVVFYTLRLCLAPVVETLILLDRMLFLYQNGISSVLVPIFDPSLSPRNFALLAMKT